MNTHKAKLGKPFEDDGTFSIDKGDKADRRKRALIFRTKDNFVGYSPTFRRKEAYENAFAAKARYNFKLSQDSHATQTT
jgi:hypothetical protein